MGRMVGQTKGGTCAGWSDGSLNSSWLQYYRHANWLGSFASGLHTRANSALRWCVCALSVRTIMKLKVVLTVARQAGRRLRGRPSRWRIGFCYSRDEMGGRGLLLLWFPRVRT